MNNLSQRHHYIPEFYSKGFLDEDKKFYDYDKTKDKIWEKRISPKEVFYEWNRNTISSEKGNTDSMEEFYSRLDSDCAKAIQHLRDKPNEKGVHTGEIIGLLRFFVVNLFWRVPKMDFVAADYLNRTEIIFTDIKTGEIIHKPDLEKKIKSDPNYLKLIKPSFPLEAIKEATRIKGQMTSQLFDFEKDIFLVGDYPVLFNEMPSNKNELVHGDYIMPISSKRIYRESKKEMKLSFSIQDAVHFNALLIEQCEYYVCGPDIDFLKKCVDYWKSIKSAGILWILGGKLFED